MIEGVSYERWLDDGRVITVQPLTFGRGRVCLGRDEWGYDDGYDYGSLYEALMAAAAWDGAGDPADGWLRCTSMYKPTRRRHDGDPATEYEAE